MNIDETRSRARKVGTGVTMAQAAARKTILTKYADEYDSLVRQNMLDLGYVEKVITKSVWLPANE